MALHVVVPSPMEKTFSLWREGGATHRLNGPVVNNYCGLGNTERKQSTGSLNLEYVLKILTVRNNI